MLMEETARMQKLLASIDPKVLGAANIDTESVRSIGGGWSHMNYFFSAGNRSYLLRISTLKGNSFKPGMSRSKEHIEKEYAKLKCLEGLGIAPTVHYIDVSCKSIDKPFMIISYIQGKKVKLLGAGGLEELAVQLAALHNAEVPPCLPKNDFAEIFNTWVKRRIDNIVNEPAYAKLTNDSFKTALKEAYSLAVNIKPGQAKQSILHGDPAGENLIRTSSGIRLIDWEGVSVGPPMYDVVAVIDKQDLNGKRLSIFLEAYKVHMKSNDPLRELHKYEAQRYVHKLSLALNEIFKIKTNASDAMERFPISYHVKYAHKLVKKCKDIGILRKDIKLVLNI